MTEHSREHTALVSEVASAALAAEATVYAHAIDIDTGTEIGVGSDEPAVTASVFKVPVLVEYVRQVAAGQLSATQRVAAKASEATLGPTGLSVFSDDADWSLRDTATSMITVSDNTATDLVMALTGVDEINTTMGELGLPNTHLIGDCRALFASLASDLGVTELGANDGLMAVSPEQAETLAVSTPALTNRTTPREAARLLQLIWNDEAAPAEACAEARRILGLQVWPHRLATGFPRDDVKISGKTGTIGIVRNEIGVVEFPDGTRHAIAVFVRTQRVQSRQPAADRLIGTVARLLSESLLQR
ncbi:serine hydrolase [Leucobacter albus]|uniref:Serine hydrolase n=1 Tax=Leucobacter albus TaxID=272210 RepID=A0ABW3TQC7_9MICO